MNTTTTILNIKTNSLSNNLKLAICVLICQSTGIVSGLLTNTQNNTWFETIIKPSWNPLGYLFGPVWTVLYLLMGISLWLIWKSDAPETQKFQACLIFALQLFLNFWWTIIFFKFQCPLCAFVEILIMICLIVITIFKFSKISKTAAWVLVPYISWVFFATILNYKLWVLNN